MVTLDLAVADGDGGVLFSGMTVGVELALLSGLLVLPETEACRRLILTSPVSTNQCPRF